MTKAPVHLPTSQQAAVAKPPAKTPAETPKDAPEDAPAAPPITRLDMGPALGQEGPEFLNLKRRKPDERATEIVSLLHNAITNPGRLDGTTGTNYGDWVRLAHIEIRRAIREAEASVGFREQMSGRRIGSILVRLGFMLLAAAASFYAFWFGVVFIGQTYGVIWSVIATLTALGLTVAFIIAGLYFSASPHAKESERARNRYGKN
jgi:hypothetical protein